MKSARKRTKHEIVEGVRQWIDNHVGLMLVETRPNDIRKMWVEEVYMANEMSPTLRSLLNEVLRETGALRAEIQADGEGSVRLLRISKEF